MHDIVALLQDVRTKHFEREIVTQQSTGEFC